MEKLNLAIIFGGNSREHEVSVNSARMIVSALDKEKYNITPIAITKQGVWLAGDLGQKYLDKTEKYASKEGGIANQEIGRFLVEHQKPRGSFDFIKGSVQSKKIDLVLPIGHGTYMEDGKLQGMLDLLGLPYVFSGTLASALAMNKYRAKLIAKDKGIDILEDLLLAKNDKYSIDKIVDRMSIPVVVKPNELGSSVGITIAKSKNEIKIGIEEAFSYGDEVLIEKYNKGRELTVSVFGNSPPKALPVVEIVPRISDWFDYKAKYTIGGSAEICPAKIPEEIRQRVQDYAIRIFKALGCKDLARADFSWNEMQEKIYFFEINSIPGMTATSLSPQAAKASGLDFGTFLDKLIVNALERQ